MLTHLGNNQRAAKRKYVATVAEKNWTIRLVLWKKLKIILNLPPIVQGGDSILFLWTIDKYLFEAQQIAESLGYKLHARMIWDKVTGIPAAFTVRYGHEYLLYMYKGKLTPVAKEERGKIHTVFREKVTKHSQKPQIAYEIIERLYPNAQKLEMYARNTRNGWDSWGNEITS